MNRPGVSGRDDDLGRASCPPLREVGNVIQPPQKPANSPGDIPPHRNPPPLLSFRRRPESTRPRRHTPPRPPQQTNPTPKITQIKRITVEAALVAAHAPPQPAIPPTRPTPRLSGESRKPRNPNSQEQPGNTSLTATPTPTVFPAKAGNHVPPTPRNRPATPAELQLSPLPSFRRKPESTYPQLPGTARQHQPNCNSHPSRLSGESRNPRTPKPSRTPSPLQPNGNSHPSRHSGESRNEARGNVR